MKKLIIINELIIYFSLYTSQYQYYSVPSVDAKADYIHCFHLSNLNIGEVVGRDFYGNVTKVTHKHTDQVMVMKEMHNCTEEAERIFKKEVIYIYIYIHIYILTYYADYCKN